VHPKKVLAKKLFNQLISPTKIGFLGKTFFGCTFYEGHRYIFEISMKKDRFFDTPFDLIKEKSFHLIVGSVCTFCELKSPKWKQPFNISENGFL
jgi:hypothetical protein